MRRVVKISPRMSLNLRLLGCYAPQIKLTNLAFGHTLLYTKLNYVIAAAQEEQKTSNACLTDHQRSSACIVIIRVKNKRNREITFSRRIPISVLLFRHSLTLL